MLACFARVIRFGEDRLPRSDTRREMTSTILTARVEFGDLCLARWLRAFKHSSPPIDWLVSWKELDRQILVFLSFLIIEVRQPLELHKGFGALPKALVKVACNSHDTVNFFGAKLFLVFEKAHRCLHTFVVLPKVIVVKKIKNLTFGIIVSGREGRNEWLRRPSTGSWVVCRRR